MDAGATRGGDYETGIILAIIAVRNRRGGPVFAPASASDAASAGC